MRTVIRLVLAVLALVALPQVVQASTLVSGKVVIVEGHEQPICRRLFVKQTDGTLLVLRMPDRGKEDGILAVALTALTSGLNVDVSYTAGVTTGCGTEPLIEYISLKAAGS